MAHRPSSDRNTRSSARQPALAVPRPKTRPGDQGVRYEPAFGKIVGGVLSPLLANVLLDEVDKELEKRGLAFARYADDLNVYTGSERAAKDAMATLKRR